MDIEVHHVDIVSTGETPLYYVTMTVVSDTGTRTDQAHILPVDTLEWRAAEYGIDPADTDTLLELVLFEPHLAETGDGMEPSLPHNAPSTAEARKRRLKRVQELKNGGKLIGMTGKAEKVATGESVDVLAGSGEGCPCQFIKDTAPMSAEHIRVKKRRVQRDVAEHKERKLARAGTTRRMARAADPNNTSDHLSFHRESAEELARRLHVEDEPVGGGAPQK